MGTVRLYVLVPIISANDFNSLDTELSPYRGKDLILCHSLSYLPSSYLHGRTTVKNGAEIGLLTQCFSRCIIRILSGCTRVPYREGNFMSGLPLFNVGIRNRIGCHERQSFCPNWESNPGLGLQSPVHFPLLSHFHPTSHHSI